MEDRRCLFDKLWDSHTVEKIDEDNYLIAIDRVFLHDLCGTFAFQMLDSTGRTIRDPSRIYATPDHTLSSFPGRIDETSPMSRLIMPKFRKGCEKYNIKAFQPGDPNQGIVHVVGPELGLSLPGMTIVCGDSHTCTHGALGALAMGVGTSELYHAMCTSCLRVKRPKKTIRITVSGKLGPDICSMDIMLYIISKLGTDFGTGCAVEYSGEVIAALPVEERFTLCNLNVELGSEYGLISPDEKTIEYIREREWAPKGKEFAALVDHCHEIASSPFSMFDQEITVDITGMHRQVSWGINPEHTISVNGKVPSVTPDMPNKTSDSYRQAYKYMGLEPGQYIRGLKVDQVFIGSCAGGRLCDILKVVSVVKGERLPLGLRLGGSWFCSCKEEAEELGLDSVLIGAGFMWGEPCCSLCVGSNGEYVASGKRCISTTNRNFIGRQGMGARTHLASPVTAAMAAISGEII